MSNPLDPTMSIPPDPGLTHDQADAYVARFRAIEQANIQRITFLTGCGFVVLYVLGDLLLRWGSANKVQLALWLITLIFSNLIISAILSVLSICGLWLLFYAIDYGVEQRTDSLLYRLGDLRHARLLVAMIVLVLAAMIAIAVVYQVRSINFWLVGSIALLSVAACLIEDYNAVGQAIALADSRVRVLLQRVPLLGSQIRVRTPPVPPAAPVASNPVVPSTQAPDPAANNSQQPPHP